MDTKDKRLEEYIHPEGMEVRVGRSRMAAVAFLTMLIITVIGALSYGSIWGRDLDYQSGYGVGQADDFEAFSLSGLVIMILCPLAYLLLQSVLYYWLSGKDHHAIHWNMNWNSWGFLLRKPMLLKYYRVILLLPFCIMGVLPLIHGFCMGNEMIFFIGIFCMIGGSGDCYYCWKLRSFSDNDKIVDGEKPFSATIIKETY